MIVPRSVLAVGAHPDDLEVGAGGTLARLSSAGAKVTMAVLSVPSSHPDMRAQEARAAAEVLGCGLRLVTEDGRHVEDLKMYQVVAALDALVDELEPSLMIALAHSDHHRDHSLTAIAVDAALRRTSFDLWRYSASGRVPTAPFTPTLFVDVEPTIETKLKAVAAHHSQFGAKGRDTEGFRERARAAGRAVNLRYAEAFELGRMVVN